MGQMEYVIHDYVPSQMRLSVQLILIVQDIIAKRLSVSDDDLIDSRLLLFERHLCVCIRT